MRLPIFSTVMLSIDTRQEGKPPKAPVGVVRGTRVGIVEARLARGHG